MESYRMTFHIFLYFRILIYNKIVCVYDFNGYFPLWTTFDVCISKWYFFLDTNYGRNYGKCQMIAI